MNRDPGLQPERTALAWSRTAIAIGVNGFLILRGGIQSREAAVSALGVALAGFAVYVAFAARRRQVELSEAVAAKPFPLLLPCISGATIVGGAVGFWLAFL